MLLDAPFNQYKNVVPLRINWIQKLTGLMLMLSVVLCSPWAQANNGLFEFQMKLAGKGNAEAEFKVGEMYETGFGVEKNMKAAREWINKAAAQGHETANFKLLYWEIESNGVKGESKNKLAELKTKANGGNPQAMYYLGKMHAYGVGVKTNYDVALDWLNKAVFVGVIEAERESLVVRDLKQKALAKNRQAEAREQAKKESQQEEQKRQAEAQRKAEEAEQLQLEARRKQQAAQEKAYLKKISNDKQAQQAEAARQAAEQKQRQNEAAAEEKRKQALLKSQAEQKKQKEKEAQFEADPCSGKSARFLSTCR